MPGAGKTVLSSSIITRLDKSGTSIVLYFFFDFSEGKKRVLHGLLSSLIVQLYSQLPQSQKYLDSLFATKGQNGAQQPSMEDLTTTLNSMLSIINGKAQIIIDALDECSTRKELLLWIEQLSSLGLENLSLLVTSRDELDIERGLARWLQEKHFISIQANNTDPDIQVYVHNALRTYPEFQRWEKRPDVLEKMETELMKRADGM